MRARIVWTRTVWQLFSELPPGEQSKIGEKLPALEIFPYMYPVKLKGRRFRRHRWFLAGKWLVYYKVAGRTVYIRGLWPAQIP